MKILTGGATRRVLLTKRYAFKIPLAHPCTMPRLKTFAKRLFKGCLCNINEQEFSVLKKASEHIDIEYCPIIFKLPFGLLNVMPRCEPLSREEYFDLYDALDEHLPPFIERKMDSFGKLDGKVVIVDYG